jgi:glutathione S-transferase
MSITMYDLAGAEEGRRFSPFCWRARMALAHKGLSFETIPWRFTDQDKLPAGSQGRVPVIVDDGRVVCDSWDIAEYLDARYPDAPALFDSPAAKGQARFIRYWAERVLQPIMAQIVTYDIFRHVDEKDKAYFRESREERFGKKLEEFGSNLDADLKALKTALGPFRQTVKEQPYLCGEQPAFADYIVFGAFQWARSISDKRLVPDDDPVHGWLQRMVGLFDGLGNQTLAYPL